MTNRPTPSLCEILPILVILPCKYVGRSYSCGMEELMLKLGLHVRFFSRAGNATGQISSHCRRNWNGNTCDEFLQNLNLIFMAKFFYKVFSCFVFKHIVYAVFRWLISLHRILFVEWNQRFQFFMRSFCHNFRHYRLRKPRAWYCMLLKNARNARLEGVTN